MEVSKAVITDDIFEKGSETSTANSRRARDVFSTRAGAERRRAADPGLQEEREAPSPPPGGTGGHQAADTRRSQEAPSKPCPVTQAPGEGTEPPPCRECLSGLGAVPSTAPPAEQHRHHCSPSATASLLPGEAVQHQEPGEAGGGPGRGWAARGRTSAGEGRTALGSGRWTWLCSDTQPLVLPTAWRRTGPGLGQAVPGSQEPLSRSC
ncbi:uncharacterized protein LOC141918758 [Strix aluco]|uniref:uncharacterized protein LOC141918758 n=1 Tax=Strix aluco TaxID=111821 RepID=UPI003DA4801A